MKTKKIIFKKGFTLIEVLVAVSIFSFSILGLLMVLSGGISDTNYAKNKIIATYLAQEGLEYTRNIRDTFVLYDAAGPQVGWTAFFSKISSASCGDVNGCYFDNSDISYSDPLQPMAGITMAACGVSCPELLYDASSDAYSYLVGSGSGFVRKIHFEQVSLDEIKIHSTVYWSQGGRNYNVNFSESLFNWI